MTALTKSADAATRDGRRMILISFYLWWIPILLQACFLAYVGLSLAEAARVGGPAWDILLVDAIPALVAIVATAAEIIGAFLMRAGIRGGRIVLLAVGLVMLALVMWLASTSVAGSGPTASTVILLFGLSTLGAVITMFTPPASAFLRHRRAEVVAQAAAPGDE
jgi:hypothetical protein